MSKVVTTSKIGDPLKGVPVDTRRKHNFKKGKKK